MKPFSLTINGKRWRVSQGDTGRNHWGHCDHEKRQIVISKHLKDNGEKAAVLVHELLHGLYEDLNEDAVMRGESAIVSALHRAKLITEDD